MNPVRYRMQQWVLRYAAWHEGMRSGDFIHHARQFSLPTLYELADQFVGNRGWTARIQRNPQTGEIDRSLLPKAAKPEHQQHLDLLMDEIRRRNGHPQMAQM